MPRSAAWAGVSISGNTRPSGGVSCLYSLDVAAAVPGKTEIKAGRGRAVQFLRRNVVAHPIDLIVGEPQDPVFRIEIHAHRITNAACEDFAAGAIRVHADNAADSPFVELIHLCFRRHVVRLAQGYVEFAIGANSADPQVMTGVFPGRNEVALLNYGIGPDGRVLVIRLGAGKR